MNKLKLTPIELMHELESAERSLVKQGSAYHAKVLQNLKGNLRAERRTKSIRKQVQLSNQLQ